MAQKSLILILVLGVYSLGYLDIISNKWLY